MKTKRYHWIFDASGVSSEIALDRARIERALHDLATICEMNIVSGPHAVEGIPSNPGFTALCIVDFSHISIHTFSAPGEVCVDIFSCKPYDPAKIHEYLLATFEVSSEQAAYFEVKYPSEV